MKDIVTICGNPGCDKDITIPAAKIKRAVMRRKYTEGVPIVGCPLCAHVLALPADIPTKPTMLEEYLIAFAESGNYLECIQFLDMADEHLPSGMTIKAGTTMYRSGAGGALMDKYKYMVINGIDPEIAYNLGKVAREPFKITSEK